MLSHEELTALRQNPTLDLESERVLARAQAIAQGGLIRASEDEMDNLLGYIAAEANHEGDSRRQRILDKACDRIEAALSRQRSDRDKY